MSKQNPIDDLFHFLVTGPGFQVITIKPLPDAECTENSDRFSVEIRNGPLSDFQSYKGKTITHALKSFLKDLVGNTSIEVNSKAGDLKFLKNIDL